MSLDECIGEIAEIIASIENAGPMMRLAVIDSSTSTTVTVDGLEMPYVAVGVAPVTSRVGVYLRQGTNTVWLGMLAT